MRSPPPGSSATDCTTRPGPGTMCTFANSVEATPDEGGHRHYPHEQIMMNEIKVRQAVRDDTVSLVAFNQAMAQETEDRELSATVLRPGVAAVFDDARHGFYLVATAPAQASAGADESQVVGSLMVTYEWSDWRNGNFWWVQSVYVLPQWRRQGIYRSLYDEVRRLARAAGNVCGVRLYVERDNRRAQGVYETLGMEETVYRLYEEEFGL